MNTPRLCLLAILPALAACAPGLPDLEPVGAPWEGVATGAMDQDEAATADNEFGVPERVTELLAEFPLHPRVDSFDVEPVALPLGGGPVLVSWTASDVANCALVVDNVPAVQGVQGELMIDVAQDADVHLLCLDHAQGLAAEARQEVTVVQPPVEAFEPDSNLSVETWESATLVGRSTALGEVHEVALTLQEDGRLVIDIAATPARAQFELWLAADVDGDGALAPEEVLQVVRSSDVGRLDEVLPAGQYSLFVVNLTGAATWQLDVTVVDPDSDGSNY